MGRHIEGLAIEFDKTEITGDLDKRNCDDVIGVKMREKRKRRIGCSEFRPHFQGVFKEWEQRNLIVQGGCGF